MTLNNKIMRIVQYAYRETRVTRICKIITF